MILNSYELGAFVAGGPWDLTCLGAGELHAHYDFTDAANFTLSGTDVLTVTDLSGNGYDLAPSAGNSPNWNSGSALVEFDRSNTEDLVASLGAGGTDYGAYIIVMEPKAITAGNSRFIGFDSASNEEAVADKILPFVGFLGNVRARANSSAIIVTSSGLNNGQEVWTLKATTSGLEMYQNGLSIGSGTLGTARITFEDEITIGRGTADNFSTDMDIKEFILLKGDVSDDTIESVEWYLANKHGYTLDAGHPYAASSPASCSPSVAGPPAYDMTAVWRMYFSAHNDYQSSWTTALGADGNTYFLSGRDQADNTNVIAHPNNTDPSINHGMYLTANGLTNSLNEAASLFMVTDTDEGSIAHGNGSYTMFVVYTWDGNTNDINYKHWQSGRKGFKIEGATTGINISDTFNTQADGLGTASGGESFQFEPGNGSYAINTGNPFFFCVVRDVPNQKYIIYTGEIDTGNTAADLKIHDTVSDSGWYLTEPFTNNSTNYEFITDEDSTLHAWGYINDVVPIADINASYEFLVSRF